MSWPWFVIIMMFSMVSLKENVIHEKKKTCLWLDIVKHGNFNTSSKFFFISHLKVTHATLTCIIEIFPVDGTSSGKLGWIFEK